MKDSCWSVSLVDVAADRVCSILKDDSDRVFCFAEILARINAHERAGGTVLLARVGGLRRPVRIERRVLAEVAFNRQQVFRRGNGGWFNLRRETQPALKRAENSE